MPTRSKLTVMGMYNYDDTLFANMTLPEGINADVAIMRILFDNAGMELMLPHFSILKEMIGVWSASNFYKWKTLYDTTQLEYNPIYNVDADETEIIEREYGNEQTLNTTTEADNYGKLAGFNSNEYNNVTNNTGSSTDTGTIGNAGTEKITNTKIRKGNIGITMTQQMIEAERNVAKFSIYEVISNDFKHEFCVMVY